MGMRIVVHEYAPEHEPDDRNGTEEVKHVRPAADILYDEPADEVRDNVTDLHTCNVVRLLSLGSHLRPRNRLSGKRARVAV